MQLNYNTTVHLSSEDCEEIIKEFLKKEKGIEVSSIAFDVVTEICGYGTFERECTNFKGATVRCK